MKLGSRLATPKRVLAACGVVFAALLAACGGGGGGGDAPAAALTLGGTAATGAAVAGAAVDAKCATGSGSGTTLADGSYSLSIVGGVLPCVLRVSAAGGTVLHSLAQGSGVVATANITPVTQLVVASLASADPASYYAGFSSTLAAVISSTSVAAAQARVVALLKAAGIDLTAIVDLISGPLKPRTPTAPGDAYDQLLDGLATGIANSGTTLAALTTAAVNAGSGTSAAPVASLPPELLLARATPTCAAMRSATYRIVTPTSNATMADQSGLAVFDAATMNITRPDGSTGTWTANGACRFTDRGTGYSADVVVSQAGVLVGRYTRDNGITYRNFVGFAEQAHTLAELAGNWNTLGMNPVGGGYVGAAESATLDAAGVVTAASTCQNNSTWAVDVCTTLNSVLLALVPPFAADAAGGFNSTDPATQGVNGRAFAYKAGSGVLMLLSVGKGGGFAVWTPQKDAALPDVGSASSNWNLDLVAGLTSAGSTYERASVITSVNPAAGSYARTQKTPGTNNDHPETLFVNNPRSGFVFRPQGSSTAVDGSLQNINEFTSMRAHGMGFGPLLLPRLKLFEFFVTQP